MFSVSYIVGFFFRCLLFFLRNNVGRFEVIATCVQTYAFVTKTVLTWMSCAFPNKSIKWVFVFVKHTAENKFATWNFPCGKLKAFLELFRHALKKKKKKNSHEEIEMTSGSIWSSFGASTGICSSTSVKNLRLARCENKNTSCDICLGSLMGRGTKAFKSLRYLSWCFKGL